MRAFERDAEPRRRDAQLIRASLDRSVHLAIGGDREREDVDGAPAPPADAAAVEPAEEGDLDVGRPGEQEPAVEPATRGNGKHARAVTTYDDAAAPLDPATSYDDAAVTALSPRDPAETYDDAALTAVSPRDPAETAKFNARADEMLAMLKADMGSPLGPMADRLATTHSRIGAGFIGLVGVTLLGWLLMTVLGHLV